ncbi:hypothetical protein ANN_20233 [Periplaneta americana]|uniref:Uncharacterized protein n=1 Tax=Periplaneta americana TaxID=6978 RepID=A0ABQ8SC43_PERAM|nr:hypothetical protein ANN_20233 [Periplaneta americana]
MGDNIKMDLREVGYDDGDWIDLSQDRDLWRAYVRAAMNLRCPEFSSRHNITALDHPPYSPDLSPPDYFHLIPRLKSHLKGRRFNAEEVIANATRALRRVSQNGFQELLRVGKTNVKEIMPPDRRREIRTHDQRPAREKIARSTLEWRAAERGEGQRGERVERVCARIFCLPREAEKSVEMEDSRIRTFEATFVCRSSTRVCVRICVSIRRPEFECSGSQLEGPEFECSGPQLEGPEFEYSELSLKGSVKKSPYDKKTSGSTSTTQRKVVKDDAKDVRLVKGRETKTRESSTSRVSKDKPQKDDVKTRTSVRERLAALKSEAEKAKDSSKDVKTDRTRDLRRDVKSDRTKDSSRDVKSDRAKPKETTRVSRQPVPEASRRNTKPTSTPSRTTTRNPAVKEDAAPRRSQLSYRTAHGIYTNPNCPLCNKEEEMTEDHLITCEVLPDGSTTEKYWRARTLMASLPKPGIR